MLVPHERLFHFLFSLHKLINPDLNFELIENNKCIYIEKNNFQQFVFMCFLSSMQAISLFSYLHAKPGVEVSIQF